MIFIVVLLFNAVKSDTLICSNGYFKCEDSFKDYLGIKFDYLFHIKNKVVDMPGLISFVEEGHSSADIQYISKPNNLHTEKYHVSKILINKVELEIQKTQGLQGLFPQNSITSTPLFPEDVFISVRGSLFLFVYGSPCFFCGNFLYQYVIRISLSPNYLGYSNSITYSLFFFYFHINFRNIQFLTNKQKTTSFMSVW